MRSAKENDFPYNMGTVCYFEVYKNGEVKQIPHKNKMDKPNVYEAYKRAKNGETTIYGVWPGNYRSDLFIIDDLETFADSLGLFVVVG